MIKNAFIRVVNKKDNKEMCKFNLSEGYEGKTALICAKLDRNENNPKEWEFTALGIPTTDPNVSRLYKSIERI